MKKIIEKITAVGLMLIIFLQATCTFAASNEEIKRQKEKERDQNNSSIKEIQEEKKEVEKEKRKIVGEVEELSSKIIGYESEISNMNAKIDELKGQIDSLNKELNEANKDYSSKKELLEKRLVVAQEAGETQYLDVILSSNNLMDMISNFYLVSELAKYDAEVLQEINEKKEKIENGKEELEKKKKEMDTAKANQQNATMKLKNAKNIKDEKIKDLTEEEKQMQNKIEQMERENVSIERDIAKAKEAIEKAKQENNKKPKPSNNGGHGKPSSSGFIYPLPAGYRTITTGLHYSDGRYHGAVDFGTGGINGQPIYAVADGYVVTSTRKQGSYGNYILIAHYNGLYTLYAHGQDGSRTVQAGDTVHQGQQIMRVGTTGNSTGPHLHFEVRVSPGGWNNRVSPYDYLP